MTLPLETINGKQYQPVEVDEISGCCEKCTLQFNCDGDYLTECDGLYRTDRINVVFIEPGDTNEQEKIKQES